MRRHIRNEVFESNSSSVHTLTFSKSGREPSKFVLDKDGYLHVDYGTFDAEYNVYTEQYDKLSYLITLCSYCADVYCREVTETYQFREIEDAIKEYTGCVGIIIDGLEEPAIDHQSIPYDGDINIINIYDKDAVIDFVFNKYVGLKTDRD